MDRTGRLAAGVLAGLLAGCGVDSGNQNDNSNDNSNGDGGNYSCVVDDDCSPGVCEDGSEYNKYSCLDGKCEAIENLVDPCNVDLQRCYESSECGAGACMIDLVGQLSVSVWDDFINGQSGFLFNFNTADWEDKEVFFERNYRGSSGTVRLEGRLEREGIYVESPENVHYVDCNGIGCVDFWDEEIVGECR